MELTDEIRTLFAGSDVDSAYKLMALDNTYPAWVVRFVDGFGVAVPYKGKEINESFANVSLFSSKFIFANKEINCLFLTSNVELTRNEFANFCSDFVFPGKTGEKRIELLADPVNWWQKWKTLIGNAISEKRPYAVLGELILYEYLLRTNVNVSWEGPKSSSHDLICPNAEYEVKSTLSRYDKIVHITGQFQLQAVSKKLFLCFFRFEKNANGTCIEDMVRKLVIDHGVSAEDINGKLLKLGYGIGSSARLEKYQVHEIMQYLVDENFPRITPEMFKQGTLPLGIKHISYDIDLSVISGTNINL
ncbi:MAG: PD-(D/E)XK motif protein [Acidaminococcaceae bacterium]|nr:PD-(D/E)XK motif protein [Acidaminococcaceae bacterium]MBQ5344330.1 PD-(D/E)XK motif protein [Acidaminococcaceae bacterium]